MKNEIVFVAILLAVVALVAILGPLVSGVMQSQQFAVTSLSYSDNGLTCSLAGLPLVNANNDSRAISVIQHVVATPRFLSVTGGLPFVVSFASINIAGLETINGTTFQPPNMLEIGFATEGNQTSCTAFQLAIDEINVLVPIINGTYVVGQELVYNSGGPK